MNYTELFYWLVVADNARTFFITFTAIFTFISVVSTMVLIFLDSNNKEDRAITRKWIWWSYPFMIFFWFLLIFTPSKKDALLIIAGGQTLNFLTTDESTKQIPSELSAFILNEIKNMAAESKVELGLMNEKERMLEEIKKMSQEELIKKMQENTEFANFVLKNRD